MIEQLALSLSDRRRDHLGFARVDAVVGEGVVPGGEIVIDSFGEFGEEPFGEIRQLGGYGMVDGLELLPRQCLGVGVLCSFSFRRSLLYIQKFCCWLHGPWAGYPLRVIG